MKYIFNVRWQSGFELHKSPPKNKATAILAIQDKVKKSYFVLPEIFIYDEKQKTFVGELHGKPQDKDFWYMLEKELLFPFEESVPVFQARIA